VAAFVGFDLRGGSPMDASTPENRSDLPVHELARSVASVLDDHHIKFADACAGLARRRPEVEPLIRAMLTARLAGRSSGPGRRRSPSSRSRCSATARRR
jgi:hypothetical protein